MLTDRAGKLVETRIRRKDGTFFDADLSIGHIRALEDEQDGLICSIRDITQRKARENELRFSASLQENVSDAVIATDLDFRIHSWNRAAEVIYGWEEEEILGKTVMDVLKTQLGSDEERDRVVDEFLKQGWYRGEFVQYHKNGAEIHVLGSTTIFRDDLGVPIGVVSVNHDITERIQAESELRRREKWYRTLAGNLPRTTVFLFDQDMRYFVVEGPDPTFPREVMEGKT
ncbi:MAG: PAS domain S-box protein, partial [Candidatus Methanoperedens sp.]|nr:PAS domain S-box protein [Candidatus Methanoperedens sp.]